MKWRRRRKETERWQDAPEEDEDEDEELRVEILMVSAQGEDFLSFLDPKFQKAADLARCLQPPDKTDPGLMD